MGNVTAHGEAPRNRAGASTPFIAFMLQVIHVAWSELEGTPQVTPQVARLLGVLDGVMDPCTRLLAQV